MTLRRCSRSSWWFALIVGCLVSMGAASEGRGATGLGGGHTPVTSRASQWVASASLGMTSVRELEDDLGAGTTGLLRATSKKVRQIFKVIKAAGGRWLDWIGGLLLFSLVVLFAGVLDGELLLRWQEHGFRAFLSALWLGCVVFLRLLFDSSTPTIAKLLIGFSLLYAVAPTDLSPDSREAIGWIDDLSLLYLAARNFMLACPDGTIERHARAVASAADRAG